MNKVAKNTVYYMIGLFVYLFSQWLMSILVVRLSGSYEEAGAFGIALSVTNVFFVISTFSLRNYQVADVNNRFSNSEYMTFRIITCAISVLVLPIYLTIMQYSIYTSFSVLCYMMIKTVEAIIDVIHSFFQKSWRLDLACKSYIIRGIVNLSVFSLAEFIFKNLVLSLFLTVVASLICTLLTDIKYCKSMFHLKIYFSNPKLIKLAQCGLPLFVHGFLSILIYNVPRITAQKLCGEEMFGYYASVAAPTVVIQMVVNSIFSPCITVMSEQYAQKDRKLFKTIMRIQGIIFVVGLIAVAGFSLLGNWFLEFMFGRGILAYVNLLVPAVVAAVLISIAAFVSAIFTVINHNVMMAVLEGIAFVISLILSLLLIDKFGLQGINYSLIFSCLFFIIIGYGMMALKLQKTFKEVTTSKE